MVTTEQVVQRIADLSPSRALVLIGIDGLGGAGKSTFASDVARRLLERGKIVSVIHFDDFVFPTEERPREVGADKPIGGDFDWKRLRDEVLVPLRSGRVARFARYDWPTDTHAETHEIHPEGTVLVEGVSTCRGELSGLYDLRIWVECSRSERLKRGIERDGESASRKWEGDWMPAEDRYARGHGPAGRADYRVCGEAR